MSHAAHRRPRARNAVAAVAAAGLLLALAACSSATSTPSATHSRASDHAHSSTSPSASASPSPTPTAPPTPVTMTCTQLLTAQQVYDFNPNVGTDPGYSPKAGTPAAQVAGQKGATCGLLDQTSNAVIEYAVAQPAPTTLATIKANAATTLQAVPTYGTPPAVTGFFALTGGTGIAEAFQGNYWVVVDSTTFAEPGDAAQLMQSVLGNLPK